MKKFRNVLAVMIVVTAVTFLCGATFQPNMRDKPADLGEGAKKWFVYVSTQNREWQDEGIPGYEHPGPYGQVPGDETTPQDAFNLVALDSKGNYLGIVYSGQRGFRGEVVVPSETAGLALVPRVPVGWEAYHPEPAYEHDSYIATTSNPQLRRVGNEYEYVFYPGTHVTEEDHTETTVNFVYTR